MSKRDPSVFSRFLCLISDLINNCCLFLGKYLKIRKINHRQVPTVATSHLVMADNHYSDGELILIMRGEDPTAGNRAYVQISEDPSVKTAIEALLRASESKDVAVAYLQLRAFQSLTSIVRSKKFEEKHKGDMSPLQVYVRIFGNLLSAEPIRTGQEPQSDLLFKEFCKKDGTVINTVKKVVKNYPLLKAQEVLAQGLGLFYEAIYEEKYKGQATLQTYLIGICKMLILGSGSIGTIKIESGGETKQVKCVISTDSFDFLEGNDDFVVELAYKSDEQQLLERIVDQVLDSKSVTERCKKALVLQYREELSMTQIAEMMGIAKQSAKNNAGDCREQLGNAIKAIKGLETYLKEILEIR